ncbi:MAG: 4Fe-4S binding protein [Spirochaetota bacterium]
MIFKAMGRPDDGIAALGMKSPSRRLLDKWRAVSPALLALIAIGGYFQPLLGLGVLGLMAVALILNFREKRSFCAGVCPNGTFYSRALKPVSRGKVFPRSFATPQIRRMLCAAMMLCMIGLLARNGTDASGIGGVFWMIYAIALTAGTFIGIFYKPRTWCTICPMGTLQDTIAAVASRPGTAAEK